jgi:tetratricopeptide (TPR) repeat protein
LREIARFSDLFVLDVYQRAVTDPHPLPRAAAVGGIERLIPRAAPESLQRLKLEMLVPLLEDPVRAVRVDAARVVASVAETLLPDGARPAFEAALAEFQERQASVADRPEGHLNLAVLYEDLGRVEDAEAAYETALRLDPRFSPARFNLANLLNRQGRNEEAEVHLRAVVASEADSGEAHYSLGLLLAEMDRLEEAAGHLERAAALLPHRPRVHYNFGLVLQRLDRLARAGEALERAHDLDPEAADVVHALAVFYGERRRWGKARAYARRLVQMQPGNADAHRLLQWIERGGR